MSIFSFFYQTTIFFDVFFFNLHAKIFKVFTTEKHLHLLDAVADEVYEIRCDHIAAGTGTSLWQH